MSVESPQSSVEQPMDADFELVIARHAEYYDIASENKMFSEVDELPNQQKKDAVENIKAKLGHLTESGTRQAAEMGLRVLEEALTLHQPVDITFIASSQQYESPRFVDAPWGGKRAEETAVVAINAILDKIQSMIDDKQLQPGFVNVLSPVPARALSPEERPNRRITEREVYYSPKSHNSLIDVYKSRTQEITDRERQLGHALTTGFVTLADNEPSETVILSNREKEIWARGQEDLDEFARQIDNETSQDVSDRTMDVIADISDLAALHSERSPGRKLIVVLVAHDALVGAVTHKAFGIDTPIIPAFAKSLNVHVKGGIAELEYDGQIHQAKVKDSA